MMVAAVWTAAWLVGCAADPGPGASDPGRMSEAEYDLGRDAFQTGRLREALSHVQKALDLDDDNADAAYLGTVVLLQFCAKDERSSDCRFVEAERLARAALEAAPEMRDAKNALGVILVHQRRYEEAIAVLEPLANDIVYASPEKAWGNMGWAYLLWGKVDQAIAALERAVAAQPSFCFGHYWLGIAFQRKGDHAAAREALGRALGVPVGECAKLQDALAARAESLSALGMADEARADLVRCRDLAAQNPVGKKCAAALESPR